MSDISKQRIVVDTPAMRRVVARRDIQYATGADGELRMDIYRPDDSDAPRPAVVFVSGFSDPGFAKVVGCKFKEMGAYVSWAQLVASRGMTAVTYENVDPACDARKAIEFVQSNAGDLGVEPARVGIWACSGNVPTALSLLTDPPIELRCAALCYGYSMDLDGHTEIADTASQFRFANPMSGVSIDDLRHLPTLIVRAGQDEWPHLNESSGRFVAAAIGRNFPLTFINYPNGSHAFDLNDDNDHSRAIIARIVDYLSAHLEPA